MCIFPEAGTLVVFPVFGYDPFSSCRFRIGGVIDSLSRQYTLAGISSRHGSSVYCTRCNLLREESYCSYDYIILSRVVRSHSVRGSFKKRLNRYPIITR